MNARLPIIAVDIIDFESALISSIFGKFLQK